MVRMRLYNCVPNCLTIILNAASRVFGSANIVIIASSVYVVASFIMANGLVEFVAGKVTGFFG
jgi:hypothetical protein